MKHFWVSSTNSVFFWLISRQKATSLKVTKSAKFSLNLSTYVELEECLGIELTPITQSKLRRKNFACLIFATSYQALSWQQIWWELLLQNFWFLPLTKFNLSFAKFAALLNWVESVVVAATAAIQQTMAFSIFSVVILTSDTFVAFTFIHWQQTKRWV